MLVVTTNDIVGKNITEVKGLVQGGIVKSKHIGRDIGAGFKTIIGGEISGYTDLMNEAREEARERMVKEAEALGANAIVAARYQTSQVMNAASEVIAYGTAVTVE